MSIPFFVDSNGMPMVLKQKPPTPSQEVETTEPTLAEIAQAEARKQSTKQGN
jgi:hypothetical protein